jgi:hypothetical protein
MSFISFNNILKYWGAAWLSGVQHGLVVSVLGCCMALGSNPARHPTLGPAGRKLFAQMQESHTQLRKKEYPAGEHPEEE